MLSQLIILAILILLNAYFAASEIAFISLNDAKIEKMAKDGNKKAKQIQSMLESPSKFLATIQIGITLAGFLSSAFASDAFAEKLAPMLFDIMPFLSLNIWKSISIIIITIIIILASSLLFYSNIQATNKTLKCSIEVDKIEIEQGEELSIILKMNNENNVNALNARINYDNEITKSCAKEAKSKVVFFSGKEKLENGYIVENNTIKKCTDGIRKHILDTSEVLLRGEHNYENIAIALAATEELVDTEVAIQAVKEFKAVEHRLEFIREIDGCKWYNDSVSSSPTRTIAGLKSFDEEIVLIAGGYDKNLDYTPIAKPILEKVKTLILLGQTSGKIFDAVKNEEEKEGKSIDIYICENLKDTVELAKKIAKPNQVVLFSPASASFDLFKNFEERGNLFKELVNNL